MTIVNHLPGPSRPSAGLTRRSVLRFGALAILAPPVLAACTPKAAAPPGPDVLTPLLTAARADVATANAAAAAFASDAPTFQVAAQVRQQQATALQAEIDRAAASSTAPRASKTPSAPAQPPSSASAASAALIGSLNTAAQQAATLAVTVPRYRAGLLGSVSGGCASLAEALGATEPTAAGTDALIPAGSTPADSTLPTDTGNALQQALAAEHAALWVCGTATAFVSGAAATDVANATVAHQVRRDDTEALVSAGGLTPQQAQPAYTTPQPITDEDSALAALAVAESDAEVAWRAVLENTDAAELRTAGVAGLTGAVLWQTRWRRLAGQTPSSVAMPGQPS
ncbi:MAG TPA: ferritin-like domain-containing protein [Pseudonocardiaceae bacterium]|nr:ferritin-like domain-containing protein [Pseudonocardiaceae bacterium]